MHVAATRDGLRVRRVAAAPAARIAIVAPPPAAPISPPPPRRRALSAADSEAAPAASDAPTTTAFETAHKKAGEKQLEFLALLKKAGDPDQRREIVKEAAAWRAKKKKELRKAQYAAQMSRAKKGAWDAVEDAALRREVAAAHGTNKWPSVALGVDGRTADQCRKRYGRLVLSAWVAPSRKRVAKGSADLAVLPHKKRARPSGSRKSVAEVSAERGAASLFARVQPSVAPGAPMSDAARIVSIGTNATTRGWGVKQVRKNTRGWGVVYISPPVGPGNKRTQYRSLKKASAAYLKLELERAN